MFIKERNWKQNPINWDLASTHWAVEVSVFPVLQERNHFHIIASTNCLCVEIITRIQLRLLEFVEHFPARCISEHYNTLRNCSIC